MQRGAAEIIPASDISARQEESADHIYILLVQGCIQRVQGAFCRVIGALPIKQQLLSASNVIQVNGSEELVS